MYVRNGQLGLRCFILVLIFAAVSWSTVDVVAQQTDWQAAGTGGAVSAGGSESVAAGISILEQDGNAFDAAAATIFSLAVTDFGAFAIGGEVPIIIWDAQRSEAKVLSGLGKAPSDISYYLANGIPTNGDLRAAPTPGAIHACLTMLRMYGTMSFEEVVQPMRALLQARTGTTRFANLLTTIDRMVTVEQATLAGGGTREEAIDAVIAEVYDASVGQIAQDLISWYEAGGHFFTAADLASQTTLIEDPVTIPYTNGSGEAFEILKCDTWTQGPTLSQTLRLLDSFDLASMGHLTADYIHVCTEALKLGFADRDTYYGDPNFSSVPIVELLSDAYTAIRVPLIDLSTASFDRRPGDPIGLQPVVAGAPAQSNNSPIVPDTTTCVVADRFGNLVVATPSCNVFGPNKDGGVTGITHCNRLRSLNTAPGHPNVIEPGKRPRITLTPSLVLRNGQPLLGVSVAGGDLQEQTSLNVILNVIEFGMLPAEAVTQPRFNTSHHENSFNPTPDRDSAFVAAGSLRVNTSVSQGVRNDLSARGHNLTTTSGAIASPSAILVDPDSGVFFAAGDPQAGRHAAAITQSDGSILTADFDTDESGFTYFDDAFGGTNAPTYSNGVLDLTGGFSGGALRVDIGGIDNADISGMSGGWETIFSLSQPTEVTLSFRYNLTQAPNYESNEFSQVLVAIDGVLIGTGSVDFVNEIAGDGNGGSSRTTGWQTFSVLLGLLPAGDHTLMIGGYNNLKTYNDETTVVLIDDVLVGGTGGSTPVVMFTAPPDGTTVSGDLPIGSIVATAYDPAVGTADGDGIADVLFELVQGPTVFDSLADSQPPYEYGFDSVPLADGFYTVRATAMSSADTTTGVATLSLILNNSGRVAVLAADFENDSDGFVYSDDTFLGTNQPVYANGARFAAGGNGGGGALQVVVGGVDDADILGMSGGWTVTFDLSSPSDVTLEFAFNLTISSEYESDEFGQMLASVDGFPVGVGSNDFVAQIVGNGNGGSADSTGWQVFSVDLGTLGSGQHALTLGGYNNKKTLANESVDVRVDDVLISAVLLPNQPPFANNDSAATFQGESVEIDLVANDVDSDGTINPPTVNITTLPLNGTLSLNPTAGIVTYQHDGSDTTSDVFTYTVEDNDGAVSNEATVSVAISPVPTDEILILADFDQSDEGFVYVDDPFRGTNASQYAQGQRLATSGVGNSGALRALVGGVNNADIFGMSGGWRQTFTLGGDRLVTIRFDYNLTISSEYESDEFGQALVSVDGQLRGPGGGDTVAQLSGNGNGGPDDTTGFQTIELNLGVLTAGSHTVTIGAYNNKKTYNNEEVEVLIDNVEVTATTLP